jgi:hypothetical protein
MASNQQICLCHLEQIIRVRRRHSRLLTTRHFEENSCSLYPAKRSPVCCFIGGRTVYKKWKYLLNNSHTELKKMNANQCGDPDTSRDKRESDWSWFKLLLPWKRTRSGRKTKFDFEFGVLHHCTVPKQDQLFTSNRPEKLNTYIG